jgi:hypothetical protein
MAHTEPMNTTTNRPQTYHQRKLDNSYASLRMAEALRDMLAANPLPGNCYYDDAVRRADELAAEMQDDLDCTMEECMAAGFGPEDFA